MILVIYVDTIWSDYLVFNVKLQWCVVVALDRDLYKCFTELIRPRYEWPRDLGKRHFTNNEVLSHSKVLCHALVDSHCNNFLSYLLCGKKIKSGSFSLGKVGEWYILWQRTI